MKYMKYLGPTLCLTAVIVNGYVIETSYRPPGVSVAGFVLGLIGLGIFALIESRDDIARFLRSIADYISS